MHMVGLRWTELIKTFDALLYAKVTQSLDGASIVYRVTALNTGNGDRRSGAIGAFGEKAQYATQYCIYVKKSELDLARHTIRG